MNFEEQVNLRVQYYLRYTTKMTQASWDRFATSMMYIPDDLRQAVEAIIYS